MRVTGADPWTIRIKIVMIVRSANDPNIWMVRLEITVAAVVPALSSRIQGHKNDTVIFHQDSVDVSKRSEKPNFRLTYKEKISLSF